MDHRGLRARLAGAGCTSCGAAIPSDRIDVLADRGDVAFVELHCPACSSRTVGLVLGPEHGMPATQLDTDPHPDTEPLSEARLAGGPPVTTGDVRTMRAFLAGWQGDVRTMLSEPGGRRRSHDAGGRGAGPGA
jgi:hypothetical protein